MMGGGDRSTSSAAASSSLSSSVASETTSSTSVSRCGTERTIVIEEMDAARALAEFAQIALLERGEGGSARCEGVAGERGGREWGNTARRRRNKRVKRSGGSFPSPAGAEREKLGDGAKGSLVRPFSLDLNQNAPPEEEHNQQERTENCTEAKRQAQSTKIRACCSTSRLPLRVGRSKPELTEAEKEAKRLRRVLANRESARQTIRRRQALCEELRRKVTELSQENEKMRKEIEHALKEYLLLNDTNRHLKEKIAERTRNEALTHLELETPTCSSTKHPLVIHQRSPFIKFACPPIGRSLYPMKTHPNSVNSNPSLEEGTYGMATGPLSPFYIPPYIWFYPVLQQRPSSVNACAWGETGGDAIDRELTCTTPLREEGGASLSYRRRNGNATSAEVVTNVHDAVAHVLWSLGVGNSSMGVKIEPDQKKKTQVGEDAKLPQGTPEGTHDKVVNAAVAANARKRRKELTKLKKHHHMYH